jgi:hypothetical protein
VTVIKINRAPVLTLWGVVVAQALGHSRATALTFGKYVAGKGAFAKAKRLGLAEDREPGARRRSPDDPDYVLFMGAEVPVVETKDGPRAIADGTPIDAAAVERYLAQKFGDGLDAVVTAMTTLAKSRAKAALAREAFGLYEKFRPAVPAGAQGWGKAGEMDLGVINRLARS